MWLLILKADEDRCSSRRQMDNDRQIEAQLQTTGPFFLDASLTAPTFTVSDWL